MIDSRRRSSRLSEAVRDLPPGYFALVMATGIVSLAAHFLLLEPIAIALFWINVAAYGALWILTLWRLAKFGRRMAEDLSNHARGAGFFTLPAGTCVLGSQWVVLRSQLAVAAVLWIAGIALWAVVTYGFFAAVTVAAKKPALGEGLNGTWLIAVVAMQSIAVLGCLVAPFFASSERVLTLAAAMHTGGFMLYLPLIALLLYRWTFVEFTPQQLTPPYWINMGALAISTLAGCRLLQSSAGHPLLSRLKPFLEGGTFFFWTAATWWIPLLLVLGFWRHVVRRVPLRYDPQFWGMVFPLGMYTTCTVQLSHTLDLPGLMGLARVFVWPALVAWTATFIGMLLRIAGALAAIRGSKDVERG
jgi:tellurite resistance protein TehA-like permease